MSIPYRTRCAIKRTGKTLLAVLAVAVVALALWLLWLGRFVVYTRSDGVVLDFSKSVQSLSGQVARPPEARPPVSIYFSDGSELAGSMGELTKISGYYITQAELEEKNGVANVIEKVENLPKGTAVVVDVKSIYGNFFYSSSVSEKRNPDINTEEMDRLISVLNRGNLYTIARLPAFRDKNFGLNNVSLGLPLKGVGLWMDSKGCYWLNPAKTGVIEYLSQIALELRSLGFEEVLFYDFTFPNDGGKVVFNGDKSAAIEKAAETLVKTCASDSFAVSFTGDKKFPLPAGRSRLYMENAVAADVASIVEELGLEQPEVNLVFKTNLHDTRFDNYSVLRPISMFG